MKKEQDKNCKLRVAYLGPFPFRISAQMQLENEEGETSSFTLYHSSELKLSDKFNIRGERLLRYKMLAGHFTGTAAGFIISSVLNSQFNTPSILTGSITLMSIIAGVQLFSRGEAHFVRNGRRYTPYDEISITRADYQRLYTEFSEAKMPYSVFYNNCARTCRKKFSAIKHELSDEIEAHEAPAI